MAFPDATPIIYERYGSYSDVDGLASASMLPTDSTQSYEPRSAPGASPKKHAACDECRHRKLKCSMDPGGCARCVKLGLRCVYSAQKQMGRPRKKRKSDDCVDNAGPGDGQGGAHHASETQHAGPQTLPALSSSAFESGLSAKDRERQDFENVCEAPMAQSLRQVGMVAMRKSASNVTGDTLGLSSQHSSTDEGPQTPSDDRFTSMYYPTNFSQWPDFSDMTMLPMLVQDSHERDKDPGSLGMAGYDTSSYVDVDADPSALAQLPAVPACPCLPNLYLTLSTLSTLSAFPVNSGTIETLLSAHRTGRAVIYCDVCPRNFQSTSQNMMLSSMLLTILADHWHRVKKTSVLDLKRGFSVLGPGNAHAFSALPGPSALPTAHSLREDLEWQTFSHKLLRAFVFGDVPIPAAPDSLSPILSTTQPTPALFELCDALDRRQRQWHELSTPTGEFPPRPSAAVSDEQLHGMTLSEVSMCEREAARHVGGHTGGHDHLCLKLVDHARHIIGALGDGPPTV